MSQKNMPWIKLLHWSELTSAEQNINPELAAAIKELKLTDEHVVYKASYPYGSLIIDEGYFYVPSEDGTLVTLDDRRVPARMREELGYSRQGAGIPMGIVLKNSVELFIKYRQTAVPFTPMSPSHIFALWSVLAPPISYQPVHVLNMSAGSRSFFLLPKATDGAGHRRLKPYGTKGHIPMNLSDQWFTFTDLAKHPSFPEPWSCEVIFFSSKWLEPTTDYDWLRFHYFLLNHAWVRTDLSRNKFTIDYIWALFVEELEQQNFRFSPQVIDTVKHLVLISLGAMPAFAPAVDSTAAPIEGLSNLFLEKYLLKQYAAVFMYPTYVHPHKPVYYSLQYPTYLPSHPKPKSPFSILEELRSAKTLLEEFLKWAKFRKFLAIKDTPIEFLADVAQYEFFHSEPDLSAGIKPTSQMPVENPLLIQSLEQYGPRSFSEVSPFVRGCVKISVSENLFEKLSTSSIDKLK
jgi:hypothetical protein